MDWSNKIIKEYESKANFFILIKLCQFFYYCVCSKKKISRKKWLPFLHSPFQNVLAVKKCANQMHLRQMIEKAPDSESDSHTEHSTWNAIPSYLVNFQKFSCGVAENIPRLSIVFIYESSSTVFSGIHSNFVEIDEFPEQPLFKKNNYY